MKSEFIPIFRPYIGEEEVAAVSEVLRSGWLTTGPRVQQFERDFEQYVGARHAVAVNSGTAALHLGLEAIGLKAGDEVIVPTITFTASAEVALYSGARPVLVDCVRDTFNIDVRTLEERITPKTRAIMPVHIGGQPCEMDAILELAKAHHLKIVEDAAHALSATYHGKKVGTLGDITAFSFYATKPITTGEGGMATTNSEEYAERMRLLSLHGISKDAWKRYYPEGDWYYEVVELGYKYNLTDIAAAIGIEQLRKCDEARTRRAKVAEHYTAAFREMDSIVPLRVLEGAQHAWHLYIILINPEALTIDRARFIEELKSRNIGTSVHFIPLHLHPYYARNFGFKQGDFPNAEWAYERCISLPIYPSLTPSDTDRVIAAVQDIATKHRR